MRVLIACEFSGVVRRAFRARGHEAWSCDLLPTEDGHDREHLQMDVNLVLNYPDKVMGGRPSWMRTASWDLLIAHPPCTFLCNSGVRWLYFGKSGERDPHRWREMEAGARFFEMLRTRDWIPQIAIENPIMHRHARAAADIPAPSQVVQPYWFGDPETKATCFWLSGLEPLHPTKLVAGRRARVHHESPGPDRWKRRSRTYEGIARAMAEQWG